MKDFKRILSLIIVLALLVPNMVFANTGEESLVGNSLTPAEIMELENLNDLLFGSEKIEKTHEYDPKEEVRIIVELVDEPIISYAIEEGISYTEMSTDLVESIENNLIQKQEWVKDDIEDNNILMTFDKQFTVAFNGFSGKTKFENIEVIEELPEVKEVYISQEYERPDAKPEMSSSSDIVRALETWDLGYKGEGMVVAVIDSGIDPSHKDFILSEDTEETLTREIVGGVQGLKGKFFTEKVPYGYNYYDRNNEIRDLGPSATEHGMHVAGTVVANGDIENGGIKGIAPEAQVLGMKVFSNDPIYATTFDDIYLEAIDEAIKLGANVLNMSLGSTASFYIEDSPVNKAITKAVENGIVCAISAGNSGSMTWGYTPWRQFPFVENPDIGVVGAPGLSYDSIQVASFENTHVMSPYLEYKDEKGTIQVPMANAGGFTPSDIFSGEMEYVVCGLGKTEEFKDKDLSNKIALIARGEILFADKIANAQNAGAAGVIVYNNAGNDLMNMAYPPEGNIPASFIGQGAGKALAALETKKLSFPKGMMKTTNPNAGEMSDFTSWGTTPSLELKPELTAPGGQIYSTLQNDKYGTMSGTSMASPHVAGGSALVSQFIQGADTHKNISLNNLISKEYNEDELVVLPISSIVVNDFAYSIKLLEQKDDTSLKVQRKVVAARKENKDVFVKLHTGRIADLDGIILTDTNKIAPVVTYYDNRNEVKTAPTILGESTKEDQTKLVKVMLMNTANIVEDEYAPISPRRQGAGQMNLHAAVTTPVLLVNKDNGEAKVELKDFTETSFTMHLRAINIGARDVTYETSVDVLTDYIWWGATATVSLNELSAREMTADVTIPEEITIAAGQTVDFTVTVDFSEDLELYENMFVEGFVRLVDKSDTYPDLNMPYLGFYGDWTEPSIFDGLRDKEKSYYNMFGMGDGAGSFRTALSPETADGKYYGTNIVTPVMSLMRNAEELRYSILDENENHLRTLKSEKFLRKNYYYNGRGATYYYSDSRAWDGKVNGKVVADGLYYYDIKAKVHYNDNEAWQTKRIPIYVDTKAPVITNFIFVPETGVLSWDITDEGTGVTSFVVLINNSDIEHDIEPVADQGHYEINIGDLVKAEGTYEITLLAPDYAMNVGGVQITHTVEPIDTNSPTADPAIYLTSPELFDLYSEDNKVRIEGAVFKNNAIDKIELVHGTSIEGLQSVYKKVTITDPSDPTTILASGFAYEFSKEMEFEDGLQEIKIIATSKSGKVSAEVARWFYVDTTAPELTINEQRIKEGESTIEIDVTMKDNFPILTLYHGDSEVYSFDGMETNFDVKAVEKTTTITIPLDRARDGIELYLVDIGGNETKEIVTIEGIRSNEVVDEEIDELENLEIEFTDGESEDGVTENITLPSSIEELEITWESSHPEILDNNGTILSRPEIDIVITLTATIVKDGVSQTKTFEITVLARTVETGEPIKVEEPIQETPIIENPIEDLPTVEYI